MPPDKETQRRNDWICREFERLRKGKHPRCRGRKMPVEEAIEMIRKELQRRRFHCNRNLRWRTVWNIIYQPSETEFKR